MKIYQHEIVIYFNGKQNTAKTKEYDVLGFNENYLVINDNSFTTYQRKPEKYNIYEVVEKVSVTDWSQETWCQSLFIRLVSESPDFQKAKKIMSKQFEKWLYEKHGRFMSTHSNVSKLILDIENN